MTEERKKELMEETAKNIFEDAFKDLPYSRQRMNMLIDTVAAEARKEGIEEAIRVAETIAGIWGYSDTGWILAIKERLKEKG